MGIDDALALVFAYKSRMLEILAVCASGGNVLPERGIENLRFLYSLMEEEVVPLCVMGRKRPFRGRFTPIDEIHGKDGFGNVTSQREFRGCSRPLPLGTMTTLAQTIEESEDPVTLIALSPLTDVAVLLQRFPETKTHIREIILATNPSMEGDATALYIKRQLANTPVRVTRLARGLPMGSDLEFADQNTLLRALAGRQDMP